MGWWSQNSASHFVGLGWWGLAKPGRDGCRQECGGNDPHNWGPVRCVWCSSWVPKDLCPTLLLRVLPSCCYDPDLVVLERLGLIKTSRRSTEISGSGNLTTLLWKFIIWIGKSSFQWPFSSIFHSYASLLESMSMSLGVTQRARIKPWLDWGILVYVFDCTLDPVYVILLALFNDVTMIPVAEDTGGIPGVDFLGDNFILGQTFILQVRPRRGPYGFFSPIWQNCDLNG
jgi:hypothetical protein